MKVLVFFDTSENCFQMKGVVFLFTAQQSICGLILTTGLVIFPTLEGYRKHPLLVDSRLITEILAYKGTGELRILWQKHEDLIRTVPVDDEGVWIDLEKYKIPVNLERKEFLGE